MGRPRKNFVEIQEEVRNEPPEVAVDASPNLPKLKVKVVSIGDYLEKARAIYGKDDIWNKAIELIYSENKVIAVIDKKGEQRFVVEL